MEQPVCWSMLVCGKICTTNMANSRCRALHGSDGIIDKAGFVDGVLATTWLPPGRVDYLGTCYRPGATWWNELLQQGNYQWSLEMIDNATLRKNHSHLACDQYMIWQTYATLLMAVSSGCLDSKVDVKIGWCHQSPVAPTVWMVMAMSFSSAKVRAVSITAGVVPQSCTFRLALYAHYASSWSKVKCNKWRSFMQKKRKKMIESFQTSSPAAKIFTLHAIYGMWLHYILRKPTKQSICQPHATLGQQRQPAQIGKTKNKISSEKRKKKRVAQTSFRPLASRNRVEKIWGSAILNLKEKQHH